MSFPPTRLKCLNSKVLSVGMTTADYFTFWPVRSLAPLRFLHSLNPDARARINSVFIISLFLGQTMGSAAGTRAYTARPGGGWHASSGLSVGLLALAIVVLLARGPHAEKWIGWDGGSNLRKGKMTNTAAAGGAPGSVVATTDDDEEEKSPGKEAIVERNDVEKG